MRCPLIRIMCAVYLLVSCSTPQIHPSYDSEKPRWELALAVSRILSSAHRGGSLIYKGECESEGRITDTYPLQTPVRVDPMDQALNEIVQKYPNIYWLDFGENSVRILDRSANIDLLNLIVRDFEISKVKTSSEALSAIWNTPEVVAFAKLHHVHFVTNVFGAVPSADSHQLISVNLKNVSVAEILENVTRSYRPKDGANWHGAWSYHECEAHGEMMVELAIL